VAKRLAGMAFPSQWLRNRGQVTSNLGIDRGEDIAHYHVVSVVYGSAR
jgi:hypothetical protein